jgi:hypothetical protein
MDCNINPLQFYDERAFFREVFEEILYFFNRGFSGCQGYLALEYSENWHG